MVRKIVNIDDRLCNGCSLCAEACHEGAIKIVDGKAKLIRDDYCDGLGNCLPMCPTGAISFEEKDTLNFDASAVARHLKKQENNTQCNQETYLSNGQWPLQIQLVNTNASFFENCDLVVAADCVAFACSDFGKAFMKGKVTIIGCPKLDDVQYSQKLSQIFLQNNIKSITVVRMSVPCCGGIVYAVNEAVKVCGKDIFTSVATIDTQGYIC